MTYFGEPEIVTDEDGIKKLSFEHIMDGYGTYYIKKYGTKEHIAFIDGMIAMLEESEPFFDEVVYDYKSEKHPTAGINWVWNCMIGSILENIVSICENLNYVVEEDGTDHAIESEE